ncbi:unnamed protein product, partial [Prorocentrum cordatum]
IHNRGVDNHKLYNDHRWDGVIKSMESPKPHLKGKVVDLCEFVKKWSGGPDACYLKNLDAWAKTSRYRKEVSGATFRALASLGFCRGPELVIAMLKACTISLEPYTSAGVSKLLSSTDLGSALTKHKEEVLKFAAAIRSAKAWPEDLRREDMYQGIGAVDVTKALGDMEVRSATFVMNQKMQAPKRVDPATMYFSADGGINMKYLAPLQLQVGGIAEPKKEDENVVWYRVLDSSAHTRALRELHEDECKGGSDDEADETKDDQHGVKNEAEVSQKLELSTGALADDYKAVLKTECVSAIVDPTAASALDRRRNQGAG